MQICSKGDVMKSPWQLGLLAIAVTGVSTYDYLYFAKRNQKPAAIAIQVAQPAAEIAEPLLAPLPESAAPESTEESIGEDLQPPISLDELQKLSRQPYVAKDFSEVNSKTSWPRRDPFTESQRSELQAKEISVMPIKREMPVQRPKPAPQCIFSGTLLDGSNRLALVDGMPLSIGDRLKGWQLVRIESDYIVFESGKESHRIELAGFILQTALRKDSL
jgi:hypothetical protein